MIDSPWLSLQVCIQTCYLANEALEGTQKFTQVMPQPYQVPPVPGMKAFRKFPGHFRNPDQMILKPVPFSRRLSLPGMGVKFIFHGVAP